MRRAWCCSVVLGVGLAGCGVACSAKSDVEDGSEATGHEGSGEASDGDGATSAAEDDSGATAAEDDESTSTESTDTSDEEDDEASEDGLFPDWSDLGTGASCTEAPLPDVASELFESGAGGGGDTDTGNPAEQRRVVISSAALSCPNPGIGDEICDAWEVVLTIPIDAEPGVYVLGTEVVADWLYNLPGEPACSFNGGYGLGTAMGGTLTLTENTETSVAGSLCDVQWDGSGPEPPVLIEGSFAASAC